MIYDSNSNPRYNRGGPYEIGSDKNGVVGFRGLRHSRYIDAAVGMWWEGKMTSFIFQDEWVYKWDKPAPSWDRNVIPTDTVADGWPKITTTVFPGLPARIDTAFTWNYDYNTYFFKGKYMYIWDFKTNKADGPYYAFNKGWQNVCDIYQCQAAPKQGVYRCESWDLTKKNCPYVCS